MSNEDVRTDIPMQDVFISWTGKDRELKNRIVEYLRANDITVTESDHDCAGDFRQWSREAVSKCTVFLLLYTKNTVHSEYVPIEIEEFKKLDDWRNRCLPVVSDYKFFSEKRPELAESESAIILNGRELSDKILSEILHKVQMLINDHLFKIYREATQPAYLKIKSFLRMVNVQDREFNYETLYIHRTVTDENENAIDNASVFTTSEDIFFLQGPAGCGKSCYIDQLRKAADEDVLVISLPCRKLTNASDLFKAMFEEFSRSCGNRHFYTEADFKSLLSVKHLLLVLDGMDEIATKNGTRQFLDTVSDYYKAHASSTTLFFTDRNADDADLIALNGQTPKRLTLRSLEEDQIKQFGEKLFLLLEKPDKSDSFYVRVKDLADEIRTNPLLLSQLAIIYDKKENIPQTTVGIYDAVCEITLSRESDVTNVPDKYQDMVALELSTILKAFSAERYRLISVGKQPAVEKILATVLKNTYADAKERALFLEEYLRDRAMIIDGEFYHKMLLEYFTAVYYYEHCFDDYDELENEDTLKDLFAHYNDPYWYTVLQLFLVKADSLIDSVSTANLYRILMSYGITEYTLLFDTCRNLLCRKEEAQRVLVGDILKKSSDGTYPPYGPLFWYVPEYNLYTPLLSALQDVTEEPYFTKALALTRDVCWIFGHYNSVSEITDRVNGRTLFEKASLDGIRRGLCELFFTGDTSEIDGDDIYPRCFNIAEAKSWKEHGQGVLGRMSTAFEDELGLYSHEMFSELGGEYIGIVAAPYDREQLETILPQRSCKKLCALFLSPTENDILEKLAINDKHMKMVYAPENVQTCFSYRCFCTLNDALMYFYNTVKIPYGIKEITESAFSGCALLTKIAIPGSVTVIGGCAFMGCSSLSEITIPDSVTVIENGAFSSCSALKEITIPDRVTEIGNGAFSGCSALKEITIPDGVTVIGGCAFMGCSALKEITIPDRVTEIGNGAFSGCSALKEITIPDGVTVIGWYTFSGCSALTEITIPDRVTEIGNGAFEGCSALKEITIPDGVTVIGEGAFEGCSALTNITIPDKVTRIKGGSFKGCSTLTEITIPDRVTEIGNGAFEGCSALKEITIPDGVTIIGWDAFENCSALSKITIPDKVARIKGGSFKGCSALTEITVPDSVTVIENDAFSDCNNLKRIYNCPFGYNHKDLGVSEDCIIYTRNISGDEILIIPHGITKINAMEYYNRRNLREVVIPDSVTEIEKGAFSDCSALKEITIPSSVTVIGDHAFYGCTQLTEITIPDSVKRIEGCTFSGCSALKEITVPDSVTVIGSCAFDDCSALMKITIPDRVTKIRESTFKNCSALKEITFPNSVTEIEWSAFYGCSALTEITIPDSVTVIKSGTFSSCSALTKITIPSKVTKIWPRAFEGCSALTEITIPDGVTEIGSGAFEGCSALKEITIPECIAKIEQHTFSGCSALTKLNIPTSVRTIGNDAFEGCTSLTEITISRRFEDDISRIFGGVDISKITIHWI